ncbi:hypothetical protein ACLESO_24035 [Pyxidicoccus sp. 3LG]
MTDSTILYIVAIASWALVFAGGFWFVGSLVRSRLKDEQVRKHGVPAEATLLRIERTPMRINKSPVYNYLLEVRRPGHAPYEVWLRTHRGHTWNVRVFEPGLRLNVKVDPEDPRRVVVIGPVVPQKLENLAWLLEQPTPGLPPSGDPVKALTDLKRMADARLITAEEYEQKKAEILSRL